MQNLTTIAKWAESLGISRQQGYAAIKRCAIPVTDGSVDPEYATHLYQRHTRGRANGKRVDLLATPSASTEGGVEPEARIPNYDSSRARREAAEAALAEMKEAEMSGKFLLKSDVDAVMFSVARAVRDGLTNCARRIAADVSALPTAEECEVVIEREHRLLLASMAHTLNAKLGVDAEGAPA
jgi:phage terminase Nu1 subunit (DNA packaging protein)